MRRKGDQVKRDEMRVTATATTSNPVRIRVNYVAKVVSYSQF